MGRRGAPRVEGLTRVRWPAQGLKMPHPGGRDELVRSLMSVPLPVLPALES